RADQVRRDAGLDPALGHRLEHQADLALLEVAQAAVDQLARLRRRARGVVALLEQRDLEAAQRGVARYARAGDATADHDDVVARAPAHSSERYRCAALRQGFAAATTATDPTPRAASAAIARARPSTLAPGAPVITGGARD